jgi:hypothetical protein
MVLLNHLLNQHTKNDEEISFSNVYGASLTPGGLLSTEGVVARRLHQVRH